MTGFETGTSVWAQRRHGGLTGRAVPRGTWGQIVAGPVRGRYRVAWDDGHTVWVHGRNLATGPDVDPVLAEELEIVLSTLTPAHAGTDHQPWGPDLVLYLRGWDACLNTVRAALAYEGLIHPATDASEVTR